MTRSTLLSERPKAARATASARSRVPPGPRLLWILMGVSWLIGILFAFAVPLFEASDEYRHYPYVHQLAGGGGLPAHRPGKASLWRQEGSQPPLYYALVSPLSALVDDGDLQERHRYNFHGRIGVPLAPDNKNIIVHVPAESFPLAGTSLGAHLIRLLSLFLGLGTVLTSYRLAQLLVRGRRWPAILAASLVAFNPMFLFISASVNNDNLAVLLSSLALWVLANLWLRPSGGRRWLAAGTLLGLASLSKPSALALLPMGLVLLAVLARRSQEGLSPRWRWRGGLLLAPWLLLFGWWLARNALLYRDPLGLVTMARVAGMREPLPPLLALVQELQGFWFSYWALFGGVNVLVGPLWYRYLTVHNLAAVIGLGLLMWVALGRWPSSGPRALGALARQVRGPILAALALWPLLLFVGLIRWTMLTQASQGRLLFPGIAVLSFLMALGLLAISSLAAGHRSWGRVVVAAGTAPLSLLAILSPLVYVPRAYAQPVLLRQVPAYVQRLELRFVEGLELVGFRVVDPAEGPGDVLRVELVWRSAQPTPRDYSLFVQLFDAHGRKLAQRDSYHGGGMRPSSLLRPGELFLEVHSLDVPEGAEGPTALWLEAGLYELDSGRRLLGSMAEAQGLDRVRIPVGKIPPAPLDLPAQAVTLGYAFGAGARLEAVEMPPEVRGGEELPVTLYWQVTGRFDQDYIAFLHLLPEGELQQVTQQDGPPLGGAYPTTLWAEGELIPDPRRLTIPQGLPAGTYRVVAGLYEAGSGERLASDGPQVDRGRVVLGPVRVR